MIRCDVVIAGGGLIGGSIAVGLARAGAKVVIVDARVVGREASRAGAGILSAAHESPEMHSLIPLSRASVELYPQFIKQIEELTGQEVGFRPHGSLEVFTKDFDGGKLQKLVSAQREDGLKGESLSGQQARGMEPTLSAEVKAAILRPDDASVDNRALTAAVLDAARA